MRYNLEITVAMVISLLVIGQAVSYWTSPFEYDSHSSMDGDIISFTIESNHDTSYTAVLFDNGSFESINEVYTYYDEDYATYGIGHEQQRSFIDMFVLELENRSFDKNSIIELDADSLRTTIDADILSSPSGKALLMTSGAFPSTVFDGNTPSKIVQWLQNGGTVVWSHGEIGARYSNGNELVTVNENGLFGLEGCINTSTAINGTEAADDRNIGCTLSIKCARTLWGINTSSLSVQHLDLGTTYDGYESVSLIQMTGGSGMIISLGGGLTTHNIQDMAQIITSGIYYDSIVHTIRTGMVYNGSIESTIDTTDITDSKIDLYIYTGGTFTTYGASYHYEKGSPP